MSEPNSPAHKSLGAPSSQRSLSRCSRGWGLNFYLFKFVKRFTLEVLIVLLSWITNFREVPWAQMRSPKVMWMVWGLSPLLASVSNLLRVDPWYLSLFLYCLVCVVNDALPPVVFHLISSSPIPGNQSGGFLQRDGVPGQDGSFLTKPIVCAGIWVSRCWSNLQEFYQTLLIWIKPSLFPGCETGAQVSRSTAAR